MANIDAQGDTHQGTTTTSERLWQQYRQVDAGDIKATARGDDDDLDMDISVGKNGDDKTSNFEVTFWNLAKSTWSGIEEGDPCKVTLGWAQTGPTPKSVCLGTINQKSTKTDHQDRKFIIRGKDKSDKYLRKKFSRSWRNQSPDSIAKQMGNRVGLGVGQIDSVGKKIEGIWSIKKRHPVKYWLDKLENEAEKLTHEQWTSGAQSGKLNFRRKSSNEQTLIHINKENAIKVDSAAGQSDKTSSGNDVDFKAYLDPRLTEKSLLKIDTADITGVYSVKSYEFSSSTDTGDHLMSGTATPESAEFSSRLGVDPSNTV